ncbi:MAG: TonB-dependent hemoglobin/transferrin/lactoferrin family receptor [Neisseriaceae bacterium]|nr:TonB-dependent hemoglobin/transferrin/lactoferrin family receptor [Neisseriaceae bacterium]
MKQKQISILVGMLCTSAMPTVWAQEQAARLDDIVVTADRTEQSIDKTAANVSVINRQGLDKAGATDIKNAIRYEPGVSVASDPKRQGNAGYTIRGIDGNRILMMVDGVRLPESYSGGGGNGAISGRDMVEFDTLRQLDIIKGPYSSLYGSDALGGVVNYTTYKPEDLVDEEKPWYLGLKQSYNSANKGHATTLTAAGQHGIASGLLMLTKRQADEYKNRGTENVDGAKRTKPNPQDIDGHNVLAKGVLADGAHRLEATAEYFKRTTETTDRIALGTVVDRAGLSTTTKQQVSEDEAKRHRLGLTYTYQPVEGVFDELEVGVSRQKLKSKDTLVQRFAKGSPAVNSAEYSNYDFNQTIDTVHGQVKSRIETGNVMHGLIAGIEYKETSTDRGRQKTRAIEGGAPVLVDGSKTFPDSDRKTVGVYVQDAITFENGVRLTPALRYTYDRISPKIDAAYLASTPTSEPKRFSDSAVSPSISLSVPLTPETTGFLAYSTGFRTPPFDSAMMSFANLMHGYQVIPNGNLKSEKSQSLEAGLRHKSSDFEAKATIFYNRYKDFIDQSYLADQVIGGRPIMTVTYDNIGRVTTYGFEASAAYRVAPNWQLNGAVSWMRGTNKVDDKPLDSAQPPQIMLGVGYDTAIWGANLDWTLVAPKEKVSDKKFVQAAGYGVVDATMFWNISKNAKLNMGVYNIGNKKYWDYVDVKGLTASVPLDYYSRPGRSVSAALQLKF